MSVRIQSSEGQTARQQLEGLGWGAARKAKSSLLLGFMELKSTGPGSTIKSVPSPKGDGSVCPCQHGEHYFTFEVFPDGTFKKWGSSRALDVVRLTDTPAGKATHEETCPGSGIWRKVGVTTSFLIPEGVEVSVLDHEGNVKQGKGGDRIGVDDLGRPNLILAADFAKNFKLEE